VNALSAFNTTTAHWALNKFLYLFVYIFNSNGIYQLDAREECSVSDCTECTVIAFTSTDSTVERVALAAIDLKI